MKSRGIPRLFRFGTNVNPPRGVPLSGNLKGTTAHPRRRQSRLLPNDPSGETVWRLAMPASLSVVAGELRALIGVEDVRLAVAGDRLSCTSWYIMLASCWLRRPDEVHHSQMSTVIKSS
jgi:hypothetical protein